MVVAMSDGWWSRWRRRLTEGPAISVRGERAAARFLCRERYRILGKNLRTRFGEVDILAEAPDGRTIVLVEVKAREVAVEGGAIRGADSGAHPGADATRPEMRVNATKQRRLVALAGQLARQCRMTDRPWRFDVIGVDCPKRGKPIIRHHPAAFESHV